MSPLTSILYLAVKVTVWLYQVTLLWILFPILLLYEPPQVSGIILYQPEFDILLSFVPSNYGKENISSATFLASFLSVYLYIPKKN